jgi:DNA-binding MarR family transcriptional regulator
MTPQSMNEVIDALERKRLIERSPHPNHRRKLPAALTAEGRRVLAACEVAVDELEDTMLAGLDTAARGAFLVYLKNAVRALGAGFPHDG